MYSETTYETTNAGISVGDATAIFGSFMLAISVLSIVAYVIHSWLLGRIFKKAGIKQWIAWVPIYNTWKMLEMGDQKGFWSLLMLIPGINIASLIFMYISMYHIGRKFGKEDWLIVLAILLPTVWLIVLAFDKSPWNDGANDTQLETQYDTVQTTQPTQSTVVDEQAPAMQPTSTTDPIPAEQTNYPTGPSAEYSSEQPTVNNSVPTDDYTQPQPEAPTDNIVQ